MGSSVPEQQFTFASPTISETTYEDVLDFDYESWIEQSKSSYYSRQDDKSSVASLQVDADARHHQQMMLRVEEDLPDEAYELSLRDLTELPYAGGVKKGTSGSKSSRKSWRKRLFRSETVEGEGHIVKMFMPSASGADARKKRFLGLIVAAMQKTSVSGNAHGDGSMKNTAAETGNERNNTRRNSVPSEGHQDSSYDRKPLGCYPFFNSSKCKVKRKTISHFFL